MSTTLQLTIFLAGLALFVDASGFMTFPPPRRYRGKGGRPWLRRFEWDQFTRMAIEDLPEPLPEWDMYCRGVPFDSTSDQVQRLSPGGEVGVEWDITQPDGGTCAIKLVCPSRQLKQELWRGPCGLSPGKARSQALIPSDFSCSKGECFITWYYETSSRRRFCNCFDIEVPVTPVQSDSSPPFTDLIISAPQTSDTFVPSSSMTDTLVFTSSEIVTNVITSVVTSIVESSATDTLVFTSSETVGTTEMVSAPIPVATSSPIVELPGSSLEGGVVKTESLPTVYMTAAPSSKIELSGMPLGQTTALPSCSSDTVIITMMNTIEKTVTDYFTTTCTETRIMTLPVERLVTSHVTTTCTETQTLPLTITETASPLIQTQTVYMTAMQTSVVTTTVSNVPGDKVGSESAITNPNMMHSYNTSPLGESMSPVTTKIARAQVKYY